MVRARITYAAPKHRAPITDDQVELFCRLIDDLARLAPSDAPPGSTSPEYERFMLGAYACGFVCSDLSADIDILRKAERAGWIERAKFKDIRLYLHTLTRAEKQSQKLASDHTRPVADALRSGVLVRVASRLRSEQSWRGL